MSNLDPKKGLSELNGAWLIDKPDGITSFGVLEALQRAMRARFGVKKSELPSLGHGGTLDPFATGLLVVCVGRAVKLTRWFLGSEKTYSGRIRFGETTLPGDPTDPISSRSPNLPNALEAQTAAHQFTLTRYAQIPPMHSAKKQGGKALYELARQGKEVERAAKLCEVRRFELAQFSEPFPSPQSGQLVTTADFTAQVSSGTYIRVLAQDLGKALGTEAMLETLRRVASGPKQLQDAIPLQNLLDLIQTAPDIHDWKLSTSWLDFHDVLDGLFPVLQLSPDEVRDLIHGKKGRIADWIQRANVDPSISTLLGRDAEGHLKVVFEKTESGHWDIARVFPE